MEGIQFHDPERGDREEVEGQSWETGEQWAEEQPVRWDDPGECSVPELQRGESDGSG